MILKQSTCQLFVIMISEGDHHDLCSKILAHRINLLGQAQLPSLVPMPAAVARRRIIAYAFA